MNAPSWCQISLDRGCGRQCWWQQAAGWASWCGSPILGSAWVLPGCPSSPAWVCCRPRCGTAPPPSSRPRGGRTGRQAPGWSGWSGEDLGCWVGWRGCQCSGLPGGQTSYNQGWTDHEVPKKVDEGELKENSPVWREGNGGRTGQRGNHCLEGKLLLSKFCH